ncbi:DUF550 domain-containing protein [Salmonella enterica subsp. enterica]|nr:DUF550 domain-containing protein [Salmonella enterica]EED7663855.1 DUF550 domain-containing protein [Salmonella enterica subsp. enterica]
MTTITRERLLKIQQWRETYGTGSNVMLPAEEAEHLARIALASLTAEPVAWTDEEELQDLRAVGFCEMFSVEPISKDVDIRRFIPLYCHPQPASECERIRREHAEWSDATFGDVGPVGPLKHLSKEALESAAEPGDLSEWADMQFLLWDAQRRAGISDEQITQAMIEKLAINKARQWPEPKDGEPRLHIKEQPAPVVPDDGRAEFEAWMLKKWGRERQEYDFAMGKFLHGENYADSYTRHMWKAWTESRAALLQSKYRDLSQPVDPQISEYEQIMLQAGNSPVIPDGYTLVPVEPTDEMIVAAMDSDDVTYNESDDTVFYVHHCEIYKAMLAAAPQPEASDGK